MLIRLTYASTVADNVDLAELKRILQQSQANNERRDLTGILAFNSRIVLQTLEGARDVVNQLYATLLRDPRHHTVTMLHYTEVAERRWGQWSMGFAPAHADNRAIFLKYSPRSTFDPYAMGGEAVEKMLDELARKTVAMTVPDAPAPVLPRPQATPLATGSTSLATPIRPITPRPAASAATAAQAAAPSATTARPQPASAERPATRTAAAPAPADGGLISRLLNR